MNNTIELDKLNKKKSEKTPNETMSFNKTFLVTLIFLLTLLGIVIYYPKDLSFIIRKNLGLKI
jgi:amino acid permease